MSSKLENQNQAKLKNWIESNYGTFLWRGGLLLFLVVCLWIGGRCVDKVDALEKNKANKTDTCRIIEKLDKVDVTLGRVEFHMGKVEQYMKDH